MTIQGFPDRTIRDCGDVTYRLVQEEPRLHQARIYEHAEEIGAAWWLTHCADCATGTPCVDHCPVCTTPTSADCPHHPEPQFTERMLDDLFGPTGGAR